MRHAILCGLAFLVNVGAAHAGVLWCSVTDEAGHRVFMSDPVARPAISKHQLWRYSARFADAVNGQFAAHLARDDGACRLFSSLASATAERANVTTAVGQHNATIIVVGVF